MSEFDGTVQDDAGAAECCSPCEPTISVEPVPVVEEIPPAPVVEEVAPAPVVEEVAPAPVVEEVAPAPVAQPATAEAEPQPVAETAPGPAPLVIESAPGMDPAATSSGDLSQNIASSSAQTGVSLNADGGLVIGPDPSPTQPLVIDSPKSYFWSPELSDVGRNIRPVPPDVIPGNNGTGSLTHPYPGYTRVTSADGTVNFYGEGYIGPVTPRRDGH